MFLVLKVKMKKLRVWGYEELSMLSRFFYVPTKHIKIEVSNQKSICPDASFVKSVPNVNEEASQEAT